jgi:hypothetical protein
VSSSTTTTTITTDTTAPEPTADAGSRPSAARRTAVAVSGVLACAVPVVFTASITGMLVTGVDTDHRFHQLTGQGLILTALWLGGLVPLLRAAWSGRRPSTAAGLLHLAFVLVGAICAVAAPGGGAPALLGLIAVTGALVWLALPARPRLRVPVQLDPVLAPVALLSAALYVPYALDQIALQNGAVGFHADNPHFFDMAWTVLVLVALAVAAALLPGARALAVWTAGGSVVIGLAGLAYTSDTTWSALAVALGVTAGGLTVVRSRLAARR